VVVVIAARVGGLEAGGPVDVEPVDQPQPGEHLERAIHARQPGGAAVAGPEPVMDLLRAEAAGLALEQSEHLLAGAAGTVAGARELAARVRSPVGGHGEDPIANENGLQ
jgi:hypothetical protein